MDQKRRTLENLMIICVDLAAITVGMFIAHYLRYRKLLGLRQPFDQGWFLALTVVLYLLVSFLFGDNSHFTRRSFWGELLEVVRLVGLSVVFLLVLLYMMHRSTSASRLVVGYFLVAAVLCMLIFRMLLKTYLIRVYQKSSFSNRMLLVVDEEHASEVIHNIISYQEWYRDISGIVLNSNDENVTRSQDTSIENIPVVCAEKDLLEYSVHNNVDEVFFVGGVINNREMLEEMVTQLESMGITVNVNIDEFELSHTGKKTLSRVGKYAVVAFDRNQFSAKDMMLKRALDIVGSLVGMVLLGVVTIFLAPAIKLDSPGPVFFGQTRMGRNGRKFTFYKFRSMYQDAEARKKELMDQNEVNGLMFKMEDDPRITRVGKFIRKTSLDELPQFWNILKGDMSLVGTRPPTVDEYEQYEARHKCRLSMTPGLTGMWQISGRSDIKDFDEVVRLDMEYIDNWSIWKDIRILCKTVKVVFTGRGSR